MRRLFVLAISVMALELLSACGKDSDLPATTVNVRLQEFKIESSVTSFESGKPYAFVVENRGSLKHEFMMTEMGGSHNMGVMMDIGEDMMGPGMVQTKKFTFNKSGEVEFACHLPGHYEGGMKLSVMVR